MQLQTPGGSPDWTDGRDERLALSLVVATLVVAAILSVLRWPAVTLFEPLAEIAIRIVSPEQTDAPVAEIVEPEPVTETRSAATEIPSGETSADEAAPASETQSPPSASLEVLSRAAIDDQLDALERPPSMTPGLDERLRQHKLRYPPGTHVPPKPIWENAEPDQLGRTVLWHGDCYRVIADPNVSSQEKFRTFDQFIVTCLAPHDVPQELPWVDEIRRRYDYLGGSDDE